MSLNSIRIFLWLFKLTYKPEGCDTFVFSWLIMSYVIILHVSQITDTIPYHTSYFHHFHHMVRLVTVGSNSSVRCLTDTNSLWISISDCVLTELVWIYTFSWFRHYWVFFHCDLILGGMSFQTSRYLFRFEDTSYPWMRNLCFIPHTRVSTTWPQQSTSSAGCWTKLWRIIATAVSILWWK